MISSSANPQMKQIAAMMKKADARDAADAYVVEGLRMVREIPARLRLKVFVSERFLGKNPPPAADAVCVSDKVFKGVSDTVTPQGIMAVVRQQHYTLADILSRSNPLILVLESVQDPGNLGTMIRMAEAAGAAGVIMNRTTADIYQPKVVRATMGSIFRVPYFYADDLPETVRRLRQAGVRLYAAHLAGASDYDKQDYTGASAFFIGNEGAGLSEELAGLADVHIRIPMAGQVESLNAAMSATILMYEAARQRRMRV